MAECSWLTFVCLVLPRLVLSLPPFSEQSFPSGTILDRLLRPGDKEQPLLASESVTNKKNVSLKNQTLRLTIIS